ncbi:MAG TPA: hypothetical protein VFO39_07820 [Candidatus Sulfotelmatobacter sp.]|nr:hypothetical protein [Candidatus Sulfotelmatobacter sp.]
MPRTVLRYISGEEIEAGDHVVFHGNPATIEFVATDPDDPSSAWYVREYGGGVMVCDPAVSGRTFITADHLAEYEDLEFRSRADGTSVRDLGRL